MKNHVLYGILLTLVSALSYAVQTAIVKYIGGQVSTPVIVFIQSVVCLVLISGVLLAQGTQQTRRLLRTRHPIIHIFRTLFSLGIGYFLFYALKFIPLVDGILLVNTAPLMVPLIAFVFMSKKINHKVWLPLIIGLAGVVLILNPDSQVFHPASFLALAAGVCMASSMILIGEAKGDSGITNTFYYFLFSLPISALGAAIFWTPIPGKILILTVAIGVLFFIVQFSVAYALKYATAQTVASLYLSNIIFAAILSVFIWSTPITWMILAGMVLTITGAILTIRAQNRVTRKVNLYEIKHNG